MIAEIMVTRCHGSFACGEEFHVCGGLENYEDLAVGKEPCGKSYDTGWLPNSQWGKYSGRDMADTQGTSCISVCQ